MVALFSTKCELCVRDFPPGEHDVGVGVARAGASGAPLNSVDLFAMSLEVVDAGLLLHTPNLCVRGENMNQYESSHMLFSLRITLGFFNLEPIFRCFVSM